MPSVASVLTAQARMAGLPLRVVPIPHPCPNEVYEAAHGRWLLPTRSADGFTHVAFGDLFLEDVRRYREERLAGTGSNRCFLYGACRPRRLAEEMIEKRTAGATVVHRYARARHRLRRARFDRSLLRRPRRTTSIRAARTASSTPASVPGRCSPTRSKSKSASRHARTVRLDRSRAATGMSRYPSRIVCLTEETTETLYLLGEGHRVVGVSGYTVRPPEARRKPRVSAFISAKYDRIEALQPDLILAFSDLQATITCELVKRGYPVVAFNQRSIAEILQMIRMLGALVGCADRGDALAADLELEIDSIRAAATQASRAPACLLRGMGRSADFRHSVGRRAHRGRRRRSDFPGASRGAARPRPNRFV